ncbi:MAG: YdcF family protein [Alphaproteobacteria bacterium]|nr:YdcF family protein [Alphaproteobacteria bacterium]
MAVRRRRFQRRDADGRIARRTPWRRWLIISCLGLAGLVWLWGLVGYVNDIRSLQAEYGLEPSASYAVTAADAIVVATGGSGRLATGIELLKAERAPTLFISGVDPTVARDRIRELIAPPPAGLSTEVIDCCVALGYGARDTVGNAREVTDWMAENGFGSLILVTSGYHLPRTLLEFRHAMPDVRFELVAVSATEVRIDDYWRYPGSFALLAAEWSKYLFAKVRMMLHDMLVKP